MFECVGKYAQACVNNMLLLVLAAALVSGKECQEGSMFLDWMLDVETFEPFMHAGDSECVFRIQQVYKSALDHSVSNNKLIVNKTKLRKITCGDSCSTFSRDQQKLNKILDFVQTLVHESIRSRSWHSTHVEDLRHAESALRVLVVGGGPVGLMSAVTASLSGAQVIGSNMIEVVISILCR
jgi:hypothetical protein